MIPLRAGFAVFLSVFALALATATTVRAKSAEESIPLTVLETNTDDANLNVQTLVDPHDQYSIDDLTQQPLATLFVSGERALRSYGSGVYWYRFRIKNPGAYHSTWYLIGTRNDDDFEVYFKDPKNRRAVLRAGMAVPFVERAFPSSFPKIEITDAMSNGQTLYVRSRSAAGPHSSLEIWSDRLNYAHGIGRNGLGSALTGFFLAIAISSFLLALYLKDSIYLLNSFAILSFAFVNLARTGLAWQILWPHARVSYFVANPLAWVIYLTALTFFSRAFLSSGKRFPITDKLLLGTYALVAIFSIYLGVNPDSNISSNALVNTLYPVPLFAVILYISVVAWKRSYRAARFFTIGISVLSIAIVFGNSDLLPILFPNSDGASVAAYFGQYGVVFDAVMFQFALADRILTERRELAESQSERLLAQTALIEEQSNTVASLEVYNLAFSRFVPKEFLAELDRADVTKINLGDHVEREMTVFFSDIRAFTTLAEMMSPQQTFDFLNGYLRRVGPIIREHGGFVDKYIGDAVMALFPENASRAVDAAIALQQEVRRYNEVRARAILPPIEVGIGLHRGSMMLGTIGEEQRFETTVIADAVNVASRFDGLTKTLGASILISGQVADAIGDSAHYHLRRLGNIQVHGTHRPIQVCEVCDSDVPELLLRKIETIEMFDFAVTDFGKGEFEKAAASFHSISVSESRDGPARYFYERCRLLMSLDTANWDGIDRIEIK